MLVLLERLTVGLGFRVHLTERAGEAVGPVTVRDVVRATAEGVHSAHGLPLVLGEVLERVIEIAGLTSGQLLTVGVGQAEQFGRGLLGPDGGLKVSKGVNEFQIVAEQTDELGRFSEGFHRRLADGLDGLCGQLNTGTQPLKWRELLALEASALRRCVALEGQHEVEGLPAFQHLRRLPLCSCPYESPVFKGKPAAWALKWRVQRSEGRKAVSARFVPPGTIVARTQRRRMRLISARLTLTRCAGSSTLLVRSKSTVR